MNQGLINVAGKRVNIPSYSVRPGQVISLGKKAMEMIVIRHNIDVLDRTVVGWLEASEGGSKAVLVEGTSNAYSNTGTELALVGAAE